MRTLQKPKPGEYPEYSSHYFDILPDDGQPMEQMMANLAEIKDYLYSLDEHFISTYRYDEGKWTIKEILVHMIDDERIFTYRALRIARGDSTPTWGFDQDMYAANSGANERSLESIFREYEAVRAATIAMYEALPGESLDRVGAGLDHEDRKRTPVNPRSVATILWHLVGHERRHINIIKERYKT